MNRTTPTTSHAVLAFWRDAGPQRWFRRDDAFDAEFRDRFLRLLHLGAMLAQRQRGFAQHIAFQAVHVARQIFVPRVGGLQAGFQRARRRRCGFTGAIQIFLQSGAAAR